MQSVTWLFLQTEMTISDVDIANYRGNARQEQIVLANMNHFFLLYLNVVSFPWVARESLPPFNLRRRARGSTSPPPAAPEAGGGEGIPGAST